MSCSESSGGWTQTSYAGECIWTLLGPGAESHVKPQQQGYPLLYRWQCSPTFRPLHGGPIGFYISLDFLHFLFHLSVLGRLIYSYIILQARRLRRSLLWSSAIQRICDAGYTVRGVSLRRGSVEMRWHDVYYKKRCPPNECSRRGQETRRPGPRWSDRPWVCRPESILYTSLPPVLCLRLSTRPLINLLSNLSWKQTEDSL